jgi:hypothetical protein
MTIYGGYAEPPGRGRGACPALVPLGLALRLAYITSAKPWGGNPMGAMAMEPEPARAAFESHAQPAPEQRALWLASDMLAARFKGVSVNQDLASSVPLGDVEADVDQFIDQNIYCSENSLPVPCLGDNRSEPLPIDLTGIVHPFIRSSATYRNPEIARVLLSQLPDQVSSLADASGLTYGEYSPEEARDFFNTRLRQFLEPRITKASSETAVVHQGLKFKVYTYTSGLRVHFTRAYWFSPNQVFGAPTTPVEGWIMPGRYKFGTIGPAYGLQFDDGEYNIPPSEEAHLTR